MEKDDRISKFNFGSRKVYSIEDIFLEKWLLYDNIMITMKKSTHIVIDLAVYYNQQLLHIESMVMESVGVN